jgi:tetratricopeptide (TPR) repeat protein
MAEEVPALTDVTPHDDAAIAPDAAVVPTRPPARPLLLRRWTGWLIVATAAFALRGVYLYQASAAPFFDTLRSDSRAYDAWAQRITNESWIGHDVFFQAPLYPYFLATVYTIAGRDMAAVRFVQIVLGCAACVMLFEAARRWFSPAVGLIAGLMLAAYPPAMFFDLQIDKTILDEFLLAAVLLMLSIIGTSKPTTLLYIACGALLGLLCLTRENALLLVVVIAGWLAIRDRKDMPLWPRLRSVGTLVLGVGLILGPVAARNAWIGGELQITTSQFGYNFYVGNGAGADGAYRAMRPGHGDPMYERTDTIELAEEAMGRKLTAGEVSAYWTRTTLNHIAKEPAWWVKLLVRKWLMVWSSTEIADSGDFDTHTAWSPLLRRLSIPWHFGVLLPLAAAGMVLTWPERRRHGLLIVLIASYSVAVGAFYLFARYRYPLVLMLIPYAAAALVVGARAIALAQWKRVLVALALASVFAVVSNTAWALPLRIRGADFYNRGLAHARRNEPDAAIAAYRKAIRINPQLVEAYNNLGLTLAERGQPDAAMAEYEAALRVKPDDSAAHSNIGMALAQQKRLPEAIGHFREAVRAKPDLTAAWFNLGIALAMHGERDDAAKAFETVLAQQPDNPQATAWLARVRAKPVTRPASGRS